MIEPNESVALVGESGSGKSTIVQLLYRFYEPHFGQILIDGVDIKSYDLKSLRRMYGIVQQEPALFHESVRYNIAYSADDGDEDERRVIECSDAANATEFVKDLQPDGKHNSGDLMQGLEYNCGVKGGSLSGGQKQRIAIARAIYKNPKILMLDEATSALDERSQHKVQEALDSLMENQTSIVIAHRLSTIENVKRLIVISEGHVVEEGTFHELKNKNGHFADICRSMN